MALDTTKNENRILGEIVGVLEELAANNNALTEENIKLRDYIEELDRDLGELEEYVYDFDYYDDDDLDDSDDDETEDDYEYESETYNDEDEDDH